jgi:preprotein translocase subunit SecY
MRKLFEALANMFRIPDLRRRLLFTMGLLAVYRLGSQIPTPGIHLHRAQDFFNSAQGPVFGFFDLFTGGNFRRLTVFALGIMPYITASIILQLLTVVVPAVERLQREGELGRSKITRWTRYLTIVLSVLQASGMAVGLQSMQGGIVINPGAGFILLTIISLTTGTAFIMWLGEQISERGIGNGMSLIIFTGIVVDLIPAIGNVYQNVFVTREWSALALILILGMMVAVVAFIVLVERGERRIPVEYAKHRIGRRVVSCASTHMPLKVNTGGVIPVIFASSMLALPQTLTTLPWVKSSTLLSSMASAIRQGEPLYFALFVTGIVFFCFFYVSIVFNSDEAANNMRQYGGFIPGIRPGRDTAEYMNRILTRITVAGGLYLALLCLIPEIMISGIHLQHLPVIGGWVDAVAARFLLDGLHVRFRFGGTSLLIVVGVAMDTINQIEALLVMRHYEGFTPRSGRIRGRRSAS